MKMISIKKYVFLRLVLPLLVFVSCCVEAQWTNSKCEKWPKAEPPNYETNKNLNYPYSNKPFQNELPDCSDPLRKEGGYAPCIDSSSADNKILDFWGEGRIITNKGTKKEMITGFVDSYNVNHQCQVISNGPDRNRKIPNRIPTKGYDLGDYSDVSLTKYIADNSFAIITTTGSPITENMIKEMLRIIKKSASSAIIIYGYEEKDALRKLLKTKLEENKFIENPSYKFSKKLSEPSSRPIVAFTYKVEQEQTEQTQVKPGSPRQEFDTEVNPRSRR